MERAGDRADSQDFRRNLRNQPVLQMKNYYGFFVWYFWQQGTFYRNAMATSEFYTCSRLIFTY